MSKEVTDGKKVEKKLKLRYPKIEFDKLQIYFNFPYVIDLENANGSLAIKIPTMYQYVSTGEKKFLSTLNIFTTNTTECRAALWDMGIDWNEISDFDLFCMSYRQIDHDVSSFFFGEEIKFDEFQLYKKGDSVVLYNEALDIEINEDVYQHIAQYIRILFRMNPEEKITKDSTLKNMYIQKDKSEMANRQKLKKESSFSIQPLVSACVNHPGFKYNLKQVLDMSIYEFYDSVGRLNIYENTTAMLKGMYSGFVDTSKIDNSNLNFMREQ